MKIYIVASGGGHTGYAIAIAERILELLPEIDICFILQPNDTWSIQRIFRKLSSNICIMTISKLRGPLDNSLKVFIRAPQALFEGLSHIKNPFMVISTGSNHGIMPIIISKFKKAPFLFTLEDVYRIYSHSKANYLLNKWFNIPVLIQWPEQKMHFHKSIYLGPIYEKPMYKPSDKGYILVVSGTIGHKRLIKLLLKTDLDNVVIQSGNIDPDSIRSKKPSWKIFDFDPNIDKWIANASIVIGHQGVTVVEAALAYRKPIIIAYNPDIPRTSTAIDAMLLAKKINGVFLDTRTADSKDLLKAIERARGIKPKTFINGAQKFAQMLLRLFIEVM